MYKIGITEHGDPALSDVWTQKLRHGKYNGAVIITKDFYIVEKQLWKLFSDRPTLPIIIHATITGYGGTKLEPNVPQPYVNFTALSRFIRKRDIEYNPVEDIVLRVDPIIPTRKGIETARNMIEIGYAIGIRRFRVSLIDMYKHAIQRFRALDLPLPYGEDFQPKECHARAVDTMINGFKQSISKYGMGDVRFESCAEHLLKSTIQQGCVSQYDLQRMGLYIRDEDFEIGKQRKECLCYAGKSELLEGCKQCDHRCAYCYWQ